MRKILLIKKKNSYIKKTYLSHENKKKNILKKKMIKNHNDFNYLEFHKRIF